MNLQHAALCLALMGPTSAAVAQEYRVSANTIDFGTWIFTPVYDASAAPIRVTDFVALAKSDAVIGDNLTAVWFHRDETDSADWIAQAWPEATIEEAINSVKASLLIPNADDALWPIGSLEATNVIGAPQPAEMYSHGLLASDPFTELVQGVPDQDEFITFLVLAGYAAADIPIDNSNVLGACQSPTPLLTGMAKGIEAAIGGEEDGEVVVNAYFQQSNCMPRCVDSISVTTKPPDWPVVLPTQNCWTYDHTEHVGDSSAIKCWYSCTYTQTRTQIVTHLHADCTKNICTQTQTQTITTTGFTNSDGSTCSNHPDNIGQLPSGGPAPTKTSSGWSPDCN